MKKQINIKNSIDKKEVSFEELFEQYRLLAYDITHRNYRKLQNFMDFDDVLQEVYITMYKAFLDYNEKSNTMFSTYFVNCAENMIINLIKEHTRQFRYDKDIDLISLDVKIGEEMLPLEDVVEDEDIIVSSDVECEILLKSLQKGLSKYEFDVLIHTLDGYNASEISRILDKNRTTVWRDVGRVKEKVRKILLI